MKNIMYFNTLFDIYKDLLTEKEKDVFILYYEEDYSLQEIAENKNISRSAVGKMIKTVEEKLENFENILKVYKKNENVKKVLIDCKDVKFVKKIAEILEIEV